MTAPRDVSRPSVTFLYPSREIGGAQLLFARLARSLAASGDFEVAVVDYADGFLRRFLRDQPRIRIIDYVEQSTELRQTTVVVPLSHLVELRYMLSRASMRCTFLFWSIHPDNVHHILGGFHRNWFIDVARARLLLGRLRDAGNVVFMDRATQRSFEAQAGAGDGRDAVFVPVPIEIEAAPAPRHRRDGVIAVAWLGRIASDKISAIKKIVQDIGAMPGDAAPVLYVIGAGSEEAELARFAVEHKVDVHRTGILQGAALHEFLRSTIDIGIAMGTSALEIASIGVPVALVDFSNGPMPSNARYDWLFDTEDFTLGNDASWNIPRRHTLVDLLTQVHADRRNALGERCFAYVRDQHAMPAVTATLGNCVRRAPYDPVLLEMLERAVNPPLHRAIYRFLRGGKRLLRRLRAVAVRR